MIKIIIGLGNPGVLYRETYHNAGILALEHFAGSENNDWRKAASFAFIKTAGFIFVKPLVFMNESGMAAAAALKYFKIKPDETLVIHDDSDIALGSYKISFDRGAAGHKGVESIIKTIGSKKFWRLRVGIRKHEAKNAEHVARKRLKASAFVLRKITKEDKKLLYSVFAETKSRLMANDTRPAPTGTIEVIGS